MQIGVPINLTHSLWIANKPKAKKRLTRMIGVPLVTRKARTRRSRQKKRSKRRTTSETLTLQLLPRLKRQSQYKTLILPSLNKRTNRRKNLTRLGTLVAIALSKKKTSFQKKKEVMQVKRTGVVPSERKKLKTETRPQMLRPSQMMVKTGLQALRSRLR